jgi:hypothetical protein
MDRVNSYVKAFNFEGRLAHAYRNAHDGVTWCIRCAVTWGWGEIHEEKALRMRWKSRSAVIAAAREWAAFGTLPPEVEPLPAEPDKDDRKAQRARQNRAQPKEKRQ